MDTLSGVGVLDKSMLVVQALAAADEGRRERIRIVVSDSANTLFVRADAELLAEVRALLALLDR